jgi:hypothetical protein
LSGTTEELDAGAKWNAPRTMVIALAAITGYLAILAIMFALLEPEGVGWTLVTAGTGLAAGTAAFLFVKWVGRHGMTRLLSKDEIDPREPK